MKLEEAITYAIMSDGHGKTTDQIAAAINRNGWHIRKDGKPVTRTECLVYTGVHSFIAQRGQ